MKQGILIGDKVVLFNDSDKDKAVLDFIEKLKCCDNCLHDRVESNPYVPPCALYSECIAKAKWEFRYAD